MNNIELKAIEELLGMNFFIPNYQRGYRWKEQQVSDLLNDIWEFARKDCPKNEEFYCLQPLVVKERKQETFELIKKQAKDLDEIKDLLKGSWEVIDGQQRLTTIYIILIALRYERKYSIEYETRADSGKFLKDIDLQLKESNIDYYHIVLAKETIELWLLEHRDSESRLLQTLLHKVKFIWYESDEEESVDVFTRLNIGKISLTDAELIKALFLNRLNFTDDSSHRVRLYQQEIAGEWDRIEYALQNEEFWLFLHELGYDRPTRIDFLFDLLRRKNALSLSQVELKRIGKDKYQTFRYFYIYFEKSGVNMPELWGNVKALFTIFQEWFDDLELYHYVGYLIECKKATVDELVEMWKASLTKRVFFEKLVVLIKESLRHCADVEKLYEESGSPKTQCRPILLLHNIQTVINQNSKLKQQEKYSLAVFYKFPFHLFKKEKWDVEHIDSYTDNPLNNRKDQIEWLKLSYIELSDKEKRKQINELLRRSGEHEYFSQTFSEIYEQIITAFQNKKWVLKENEGNPKNKLWNFALLDASTNRSYGNAPFPAKRRAIIGKDQGKMITITDDLEVKESENVIAFIPLCTKNVFLKYYNVSSNNLREWTQEDAQAYIDHIKEMLKDFLS